MRVKGCGEHRPQRPARTERRRTLPPLVTRGETVRNRKTCLKPVTALDSGDFGLCAVHGFCMCSVCAVHE